jgi:hypothetical protein
MSRPPIEWAIIRLKPSSDHTTGMISLKKKKRTDCRSSESSFYASQGQLSNCWFLRDASLAKYRIIKIVLRRAVCISTIQFASTDRWQVALLFGWINKTMELGHSGHAELTECDDRIFIRSADAVEGPNERTYFRLKNAKLKRNLHFFFSWTRFFSYIPNLYHIKI